LHDPSLDNFLIRSANLDDLHEILEIERASHPHPWSIELIRDELHNPVSDLDLCTIDGKIAGYLCSWYVAGEMEIHNIATSPTFRRRGVAAILMKHALKRARDKGLERTFLEVRRSNVGAIALYYFFGFELTGCRHRYYADGEDALLMQRDESLDVET